LHRITILIARPAQGVLTLTIVVVRRANLIALLEDPDETSVDLRAVAFPLIAVTAIPVGLSQNP
jgi:hypothetical protein